MLEGCGSVGRAAALAWVLAGAVACADKELTPNDTDAGGDGPGCAMEVLFVDADLDGFGDSDLPEEACVNTPGHAAVGGDCDDTDPRVSPNANEICNGIDDDCDGGVDRGLLVDVWSDLDGDGYGDPETFEQVCAAEAHHVRDDSDCDDTDPDVNPDGVEVCDGRDQDCDDLVDEDATDFETFYADVDGDGMGDPLEPVLACPGASGVTDNDWDCDDLDGGTPLVVDAGESGTGTLSDPLGSIQEGVDQALAAGGMACVVVQPGRYSESVDLSAGEVSVVGVEGAENTVVDGTGLDEPVLVLGAENQSATLVEGLTLTRGTPQRTTFEIDILGNRSDLVRDAGAGVYASGARATLRGLHITDNRILDPELEDYVQSDGRTVQVSWEGLGGGVFSEGGTLVMEDCLVWANEAQVGGGVFADQALSVLHTQFLENLATDVGGGLAGRGATMTVENSVFAGNLADDAASVYAADSAVLLSQITVNHDVPDVSGGALVVVERSLGLWTNLLLSTDTGSGVRVEDANTTITLDGVLFDVPEDTRSAPPGALYVAGAIEAAPIFLDFSDDDIASNDDLHLDPDSPGVDAGLSGRDTDGTVADLGAYGGVLGDW